MTDFKKYIETNKIAWNKRTPIHIDSEFYNNTDFKKGKCSLKKIELDEIGDVKNKKLLHLQCHFGQDSISFARMGAKVTGVDFSTIAINKAQRISQELNIDVNFIESNILELNINQRFDIIFSSYGAIGWIPDLIKWGSIISSHLKKGGLFLLTEFHPFLELIKNSGYDYFYNPVPDIEINKGSYTDGGKQLLTKTCWWNHSLMDIFNALEANGLKLTGFKEFDYSPFLLEGMIEKDPGKYVLKTRKTKSTPYVFTLTATKK